MDYVTIAKQALARSREGMPTEDMACPGPSTGSERSEESEISLRDTRQALRELWPYLPAPLRNLSEEKVLALVNIAILTAWSRMLAEKETG